ncbi:MAG: Lrp/AsnC family transcriptional regulator [Candidatus Microthrix parvicella]|jgi:Lrp/AsnC family leucine-responsive transcriptional regulator|uniref:Putative Leucine-responsive regulatory protein n=2 Tax=Candidatus Neomicrothrix TaxID=41949 RepID=R4Z3V8_9ACTN|nr:Lrp/AsnC family transcriptional regulator [Candidatus Microthrix parvicella]CCM65403.1 putative Leucine-responsive regulatory protein [Candidatus Microthrix parvicella RN1]
MQEFVPMDATDIEILAALQADGRMTNRDLGQLVNLSEAACSRRVSDLVRTGTIRRFTAEINPDAVGLGLRVFLLVRMKATSDDELDAFEKAVQLTPTIVRCHKLLGEIDYLMLVVAKDLTEFDKIYKEHVLQLPGVDRTTSLAALSNVKVGLQLPTQMMKT